jgi:uncharacterized protein
MQAYNNTKPLIPMGWVRALVFVFMYLSVLLAAGFGLMLLFKGNGLALDKIPADPRFVFVSITSSCLLSFLMVWMFRKLMDRATFQSLGFETRQMGGHAVVGFFLGILLLCIGTIILVATGFLHWTDINFNAKDLFLSMGLMVLVAVSEELVFRGYILNNLLSSVGKWPALFISAFLFALAHSANPDFSLLAALNIFLAGILLGVNYIYTRNLWYAILLHFSWNFFQGPILGYEVSGENLQSLFQQEVKGSIWITGGKFGLEGSVVATGLYIAAILLLAFLYNKKLNPASQMATEK